MEIVNELIIILIALCSVGTLILAALAFKKKRDEVDSLEQAYIILRKDYEFSLKTVADINGNYSKCLDERERNLNEYSIKIKKLELELEAKNNEIERLNSILNYTAPIGELKENLYEEKEA